MGHQQHLAYRATLLNLERVLRSLALHGDGEPGTRARMLTGLSYEGAVDGVVV